MPPVAAIERGKTGGGVGEGELDRAEVGVRVDRVAAGGEVRGEGGCGRRPLRVRADDARRASPYRRRFRSGRCSARRSRRRSPARSPVSGQPFVFASCTCRAAENGCPSCAVWPLPPASTSSFGRFEVGQASTAAAGDPAPAPRKTAKTSATPSERQAGHAAGLLRSSVTIRPSRMLIRRGKRAAISCSWVITTIVAPSALSSSIRRHDLLAGGAVEVAGRLVGEHDRRPADERAGDRHPLPLAARELGRASEQPIAEPDPVKRLCGPFTALVRRRPRVEEAVGDVLERARVLCQEELLEDEADPGRPHTGQVAVGQVRHVEPGDQDPTGARALQRSHHVEQRRLPRTGRTEDRRQLARLDPEADALQRGHRRVGAVGLGDRVELEHRSRAGSFGRDHHALAGTEAGAAHLHEPLGVVEEAERHGDQTGARRRRPIPRRA